MTSESILTYFLLAPTILLESSDDSFLSHRGCFVFQRCFFSLAVNTLASSLGEKEPFPSPSLKGRELRAFSSPSPSGEGWGEALCRINEISDSADYTVP